MAERAARIDWSSVLQRAAQIVRSYNTEVTLRQLYYRLVSEHLIPNKLTTYNSLSARTAQARRDGWFPSLVDRNRDIHQYRTFTSPLEARQWLASIYRRDRTEGQDYCVFIAVEKNGLLNLLINWFGNFGVPVIALGGYSSQTFCDDVREHVENDGRPAVLIYAGDFDPSGEDILRDFLDRTACWDTDIRIALNVDQIEEFDLPPLPGKASDSRSAGFIRRHGELMQVELDALPPDVLRGLYEDAFAQWWDTEVYEALLVQERAERMSLVSGNIAIEDDEEDDDEEDED